MDTVELAKQVEERYRRYLETTFYFKDPVLRKSFQEALSMGHLRKGPYVQATPVFKRGKRAGELFRELLTIPRDEGFFKGVLGDIPIRTKVVSCSSVGGLHYCLKCDLSG